MVHKRGRLQSSTRMIDGGVRLSQHPPNERGRGVRDDSRMRSQTEKRGARPAWIEHRDRAFKMLEGPRHLAHRLEVRPKNKMGVEKQVDFVRLFRELEELPPDRQRRLEVGLVQVQAPDVSEH